MNHLSFSWRYISWLKTRRLKYPITLVKVRQLVKGDLVNTQHIMAFLRFYKIIGTSTKNRNIKKRK